MPNVTLDVYLYFTGNCHQAMEFYKSIFGGELTMQTFGEIPGDKPAEMANMNDKIMHARLTGGLISFMASDGTRQEPYSQGRISLSLGGSDEEKLREIFDRLAEGGKVTSPLKKEFWGDIFGSLTDQFGIDWMVNISTKTE
jgi:PhnB protein